MQNGRALADRFLLCGLHELVQLCEVAAVLLTGAVAFQSGYSRTFEPAVVVKLVVPKPQLSRLG